MNNNGKSKILTVLIVAATVILGAVAVFTAVKIYQMRTQSVVPTQPESKPKAFITEPPGQLRFVCQKSSVTGGADLYDFAVTVVPTSESPTSCHDQSLDKFAQCWSVNNPIKTYKTTYQVKVNWGPPSHADTPISVRLKTNSNWCTEACGHDGGVCQKNPSSPAEVVKVLTKENNWTDTVDVERSTDNGLACGSFQTDINVVDITNCPELASQDTTKLNWGLCYTGVACPAGTPPACAPLTFSLAAATPTPTPVEIPSPTPTPTATPSPNSCGGTCGSNTNCESSFYCYQGACRNPSCPTIANCVCAGKTCNLACSQNADCASGLICSGGMCRNATCTGETDCICATASPIAGPTTEPTLPNAGVGGPTIAGLGAGFVLLLVSLALALQV